MSFRPELLLHPNIPKPLHGLNPRTLKGDQWWNEQRQIAYAKYDYHCWACGISKYVAPYRKWLEAHENYTIDYVHGRMEITEITALCHSCHNFIHSGRMFMLYDTDEMPTSKFWAIMYHGFKILKDAGLKPNPFAVYMADKKSYKKDAPAWAKSDEFSDAIDNAIEELEGQIMAPWSTWRLILDGKEYEPLFKNQEEWAAHYSGV